MLDQIYHRNFNFDYRTIENDMALLRMATAATLSSTVAPVCLATRTIQTKVDMMTTGWGGVNDALTQSSVLKEVRKDISTTEDLKSKTALINILHN